MKIYLLLGLVLLCTSAFAGEKKGHLQYGMVGNGDYCAEGLMGWYYDGKDGKTIPGEGFVCAYAKCVPANQYLNKDFNEIYSWGPNGEALPSATVDCCAGLKQQKPNKTRTKCIPESASGSPEVVTGEEKDHLEYGNLKRHDYCKPGLFGWSYNGKNGDKIGSSKFVCAYTGCVPENQVSRQLPVYSWSDSTHYTSTIPVCCEGLRAKRKSGDQYKTCIRR